MKPLKLLVIEDSEDDTLLLLHHLKRGGYQTAYTRVENEQDMIKAIESSQWDAIVSDYNLPAFSGLEALAIYKEKGLDIPFIVVSGIIGEDTAVEMMKAGAHDYLMKGNLARLEVAIEREMREAEVRKQRKKAEAELRESEATARTLLNAPNDFAMLIDNEGIILSLNEAACRQFGRSRTELMGKLAYDFIPQEIAANRIEKINQALATHTSAHFEDQNNGKYFDNYAYPILDSNGNVTRIAIYAYDITERRRIAEALREREERFRNLIQNSLDIIIVVDQNRIIRYTSPSLATVMGYLQEDVLENDAYEFVHPDDLAVIRPQLIYTMNNPGTTVQMEYRMRKANGDWIYTDSVITNLLLNPSVNGIVINARDITERKRAETKIMQANEELSLAYDATLEGWSHALELREQETAGHSQRVVELTLKLAEAIGFNEDELIHIRRGALLHDIGKMGLPDSILLKPGPLTDEEWVIMRQHPIYAYHLLAQIPYLKPALDIPYSHHERWDGSGYPKHLKGEEIPLSARIFSVIDCWDALLSNRPYRPAWPKSEVLAYLKKEAGRAYDPTVVAKFFEIIDS